MGELHLDVACSRLGTEFGIEVTTGRMRIAYREALSNLPMSINKFIYDRMIGEVEEKQKRLFAGFSVTLTTNSNSASKKEDRDEGKFTMQPATVSISEKARKELGNLERSEMVKKSFETALVYGPLHGFPLTGFHLEVTEAQVDSDTNPTALKQAAEALIKRLLKLSEGGDGVLLLQPVMALEVSTPEENMGNVLTDLTVGREATIKSVEVIGSGINVRHIIKSDAPLSKLLGFSTDLRSLTSGEGLFSMEYSHHSIIDKLPDEDVRPPPK
jgi:elongation factor G